jgi:hypothetical protein
MRLSVTADGRFSFFKALLLGYSIKDGQVQFNKKIDGGEG